MKKGTKFQHKRPDEPQVCAICGFPLKTYNALGKHVAKYHSNVCTMKEYVDKYMEPFAHKCPYCDNERNFVHGRYKETCSDKACIQKHREATNLGKYGNKCSLKGSNEQKVVDAIIEKYGVDNVFKLDSMQQVAKQRMKEKYGKEYSSQVPEIRQKVEDTCMRKYGYKTNLLNPDQIEQIKRTCLEKYGNEYVCASEYTRQKTIEHNQMVYGVDWFMSTDEFREKAKSTLMERYGTINTSSLPEIKNKVIQTNMERYGCVCSLMSEDVKKKTLDTMMRVYGVDHPSRSDVILARRHNTNLQRYGSPEYLGSDKFKSIVKNILYEKYGVCYSSQIPGVREKREATNLARYGVKNIVGTPEVHAMAVAAIRKLYGVDYILQNTEMWHKITHHGKIGEYLSKAEQTFARLCDDMHLHYKYNEKINNKHWDFVIYDEYDNIQCIVEIDGERYHAIALDSCGDTSSSDTRNAERFMLVPDNVKYICADSTYVNKAFNAMLACLHIPYNEWLDNIYNSLPLNFPYPVYSERRLRGDYRRLCTLNPRKFSCLAMSTIKQFHKSIYSVKVNGQLSPTEAWQRKDVLRSCVDNRALYVSPLSSHCIVDGFNVCECAPLVHVFSSGTARYIISKYLQTVDTIFNPFHGFSGIMLGTVASGKKYIGYDIDSTVIDEARNIIDFHKLDATVLVRDGGSEHGTFDALFTYVPNNFVEKMSSATDVCAYDKCIDLCLSQYNCKYYVFVVDYVGKYAPYEVETLKHHSFVKDVYEHIILIENK